MIRKAAANRQSARVHYFIEGRQLTLCGLNMSDFKVKGEDEPLTCRDCASEAARMKRQEQAS